MYNDSGTEVWSCHLNSYGKVRNFKGEWKGDCPFRYQGQYEDVETGLYYNRFRYYSPEEGMYISQDPIRIEGGKSLYGYVHDPNSWVDIFGLWSNNKKPPHNATGTLTDSEGNDKHTVNSTSGNMTAEEKALGFPQNSLATHTEARITKDETMRELAGPGDTLVIQGEYPPCPSCKGKMNDFNDDTGAEVIYKWTDEDGQEQEWEATGKKSCKGSE